MKLFACLIFITNVSLSLQRLPMGNYLLDSFFFNYINPTIGWIGIGDVVMGHWERVDNIRITVELETTKIDNSSYLGEIRVLNFRIAKRPEPEPLYCLHFEIRLPAQDPLPVVTRIMVHQSIYFENKVPRKLSGKITKILLSNTYNSFLHTEERFSEIIKTTEEATSPDATRTDVSELKAEPAFECGEVGQIDNTVHLVLNGNTIPRGSWPWLVSVYSYVGSKLGFQCGATLVSNTLVITAAHCFFDIYGRRVKPEDVIVILGQHNLKRPYDQDTRVLYPESVNIHPNYQKRNKVDSDIAVIVFKESIQFTTYIRPACLWKEPISKESIVGLTGVIAGWGRDENGNYFTELPKKAEIPVVSDEMCLRSHELFARITSDATFCAGYRNGSIGPCNGDSGGGLMFNKDNLWTLRGIVSTSLSDKKSSACDLNEYVVFTDIVPFLDWIKSFSQTSALL